MKTNLRLAPIAMLLSAVLLSHCKCEAKKAMKAVDDFMGFSRGEDMTRETRDIVPGYKLRKRSDEVVAGRSRVTAEIEVSPGLDHPTLEKVLRNACHDQKLHRGASVIKVIAWPGRLRLLVRPAGQCVFARDGHGWDGTGVGFEEIQVAIPDPRQMKARDLAPLTEKEYLRVLGVENMLRRGITRDKAIQETAAHHEVPVRQVKSAMEKAGKLYKKPGT